MGGSPSQPTAPASLSTGSSYDRDYRPSIGPRPSSAAGLRDYSLDYNSQLHGGPNPAYRQQPLAEGRASGPLWGSSPRRSPSSSTASTTGMLVKRILPRCLVSHARLSTRSRSSRPAGSTRRMSAPLLTSKGRIELRTFLILYLLTLPLQLLTTGSLLEQGSMALVVLTGIHAGLVAATFWTLLANGIVATQVVEDGTVSSMVPFTIFTIIFFGVTTYISLDVALGVTDVIGGVSDPPESLRSIALFVFTSIWPAAAALIYLVIMSYIVLRVLNETRPMWFYLLSALLFVLGQLAWFLLGRVLCTASNSKVDGSFLRTLAETAAVGVLYLAWKSITEESWDDEYYPS